MGGDDFLKKRPIRLKANISVHESLGRVVLVHVACNLIIVVYVLDNCLEISFGQRKETQHDGDCQAINAGLR